MRTGLENRGVLLRAHPRVPLGVLYLPLRLLGLSCGSHGCQSSLPASDGSWGPRPLSRAAAAAILGRVHVAASTPAVAPSFVPWPQPQFFQSRNRPSGMGWERKQPGEAPPAPVSPAGDPSQGAPRKFASPSPSSALTAISNRCARSRAGRPGARRGRGRDRASHSALSSERAGVRGDGPRCRKSPSPVPVGPVPYVSFVPASVTLGAARVLCLGPSRRPPGARHTRAPSLPPQV